MVTAYAFVDDVDIVHGLNDTHFPCTEAQSVLDAWSRGLHSTGGAIVGKKSNWYLIIHQWRNNRWSLLSKSKVPGDISTIGSTGASEN
jgi:hypothetical protein